MHGLARAEPEDRRLGQEAPGLTLGRAGRQGWAAGL